MYGHEKCTFYNNGAEKCLGCDNVIEIDYMCVHGVHRPKKTNGCTCKSEPKKKGRK